jgi:chaperonin cofactor prefoldin
VDGLHRRVLALEKKMDKLREKLEKLEWSLVSKSLKRTDDQYRDSNGKFAKRPGS